MMAGGGFKKGFVYGKTDQFGMEVVENPVSIHDLHATILHQLGLDHQALTYRFGGRDVTLPDVEGEVNRELVGRIGKRGWERGRLVRRVMEGRRFDVGWD